jgi:hypothetical protein
VEDSQHVGVPKEAESRTTGEADFARIVIGMQARQFELIRQFWTSIDEERRRQALAYRDSLGESLLSCAVEANIHYCVMLFVEAGADLEARANHGCTALYTAASAKSGEEIVRYLVKKGANKDFVAPWGRSILMAALGSGDPGAALYLLDHGASPSNEITEPNGDTAATLAINRDNLPVFLRLYERGLYEGKEEFVIGHAASRSAAQIVRACLADPVLSLPAAGEGLRALIARCPDGRLCEELRAYRTGREIDAPLSGVEESVSPRQGGNRGSPAL